MSHEEHLKGSIAPGELADLVVLAEDLHSAQHGIKDIQIVRTVAGRRTPHAT